MPQRKKEFLVIVYAPEKFRPYLIGSKVTVYTDHVAIKYLLTIGSPTSTRDKAIS